MELMNPSVTMSSLELVAFINDSRQAGAPELRHADFLAKVPKVLNGGERNFSSSYLNSQNKVQPCYHFPKREACLMAMSYSYDLQAKVFDRMTELEAKQNPKIPLTYIQALEQLIEVEKQKEAALELAKVAIETKAEIGSRREATAMNTASQAVKKANKLEIELDQSKDYCTVKRMEMLKHGQKFNWRLLKSAGQDLGIDSIDIYDANYGSVKAYHRDVWLEAYALTF